jgi:hypothetical protein
MPNPSENRRDILLRETEIWALIFDDYQSIAALSRRLRSTAPDRMARREVEAEARDRRRRATGGILSVEKLRKEILNL